MVYIN
jgi:ubiquitin C-terminal hydrolase